MLDMVLFLLRAISCNVTKCRQFQHFAAFLLAVTGGVGPCDELRSFLALLLPLGSAFEVVFLPTIFLPVNRFAAYRARCLGEGRSCTLPNCAFAFLPLPLRKEACSLVDKCAGCWVVIHCSLRTSDVVGFCFQAFPRCEQEVFLQIAIWKHFSAPLKHKMLAETFPRLSRLGPNDCRCLRRR